MKQPNPRCAICGQVTEQLFFHDGTPDDLYRCPNGCKIGIDAVIRQNSEGVVILP